MNFNFIFVQNLCCSSLLGMKNQYRPNEPTKEQDDNHTVSDKKIIDHVTEYVIQPFILNLKTNDILSIFSHRQVKAGLLPDVTLEDLQ